MQDWLPTYYSVSSPGQSITQLPHVFDLTEMNGPSTLSCSAAASVQEIRSLSNAGMPRQSHALKVHQYGTQLILLQHNRLP